MSDKEPVYLTAELLDATAAEKLRQFVQSKSVYVCPSPAGCKILLATFKSKEHKIVRVVYNELGWAKYVFKRFVPYVHLREPIPKYAQIHVGALRALASWDCALCTKGVGSNTAIFQPLEIEVTPLGLSLGTYLARNPNAKPPFVVTSDWIVDNYWFPDEIEAYRKKEKEAETEAEPEEQEPKSASIDLQLDDMRRQLLNRQPTKPVYGPKTLPSNNPHAHPSPKWQY